jgi:hypothetical protein
MNKVEKELLSRAIVRENILLFAKENALVFVEECKKNKIQLLGIDGFFLFEDKIQPSLDNSVDFSSNFNDKSNDVYSDAIKFINDKDSSLFYEITCSE